MARLPEKGEQQWDEILNGFLLVAHNTDGTIRTANATTSTATGTVGLSDLNTTNAPVNPPYKTPFLSHNGTNLTWKTSIENDVRDFGAVGDGATDDTVAIQAAIDAAGSGLVTFPSGIFMVRGLKLNNKGVAIRGDGRFGTRIKRLNGTDPLIDVSGTATGLGHLRYVTITNVQIDGNSMPGLLVRSYYADCTIYDKISFIHCAGTALDFVEVWDSRFDNCIWEDCGSSSDPATLFRNSTASGTFGFSTDNTNQIYFTGCRWEGFGNGAICLDGSSGGSTQMLNGIFFVACKMETKVAAGPAFQILNNTTVIFVNQLYLGMMSLDPAHTTPIDAIEDHASHTFMTNVYVQWGAQTGLANSVAHIVKSAPHMYHALGAFYPTEDPATATIWVEPAATDVTVSSLWVNRGRPGVGTYSKLLDSNPIIGTNIPLNSTGTFRITDSVSSKDLIKIDNNTTRPALQMPNSTDTVGFSDAYISEKWRIVGSSGAARFAAGKFQIEPTKGYVGINATPYTGIAMLIKAAIEGDRGIAVVRPTSTATNRLMEFQDETFSVQGMAIDSNGRPQAVGTPPRVTAGANATYANPRIQVRDIAGGVTLAIIPSPAGPGTIATITFSRAYAQTPLSIVLSDQSPVVTGDIFVSDRSATSFTVSTRSTPRGGTILNFDYIVIA